MCILQANTTIASAGVQYCDKATQFVRMDSAPAMDDTSEARWKDVRKPFEVTRWCTDRVIPCVVILVEFTLLYGGHLSGLMCATIQLLCMAELGVEWMMRCLT